MSFKPKIKFHKSWEEILGGWAGILFVIIIAKSINPGLSIWVIVKALGGW